LCWIFLLFFLDPEIQLAGFLPCHSSDLIVLVNAMRYASGIERSRHSLRWGRATWAHRWARGVGIAKSENSPSPVNGDFPTTDRYYAYICKDGPLERLAQDI
jgi:hypothetical protein